MANLPMNRIEAILNGTYARLTLRDMEIIASICEESLYALLTPGSETAD